jgi:RES domain-containing protein
MVRRQGVGFNHDFKIMILEIPDNLRIRSLSTDDLPAGWRKFTDYSFCQPRGNAWYDEGSYPLLKVPSAVLPESFNYVISSIHPDYKKISLIHVADLIPDERIEALLKKYSKK